MYAYVYICGFNIELDFEIVCGVNWTKLNICNEITVLK